MRKLLFLLCVGICFAVGFAGCSNETEDDEETTYKIEMGVVQKSVYTKVCNKLMMYEIDITHAAIKSLRNYLYSNTLSDYGSATGATESEIYDFLVSHDMAASSASAEIALLKRIGNDLYFLTLDILLI